MALNYFWLADFKILTDFKFKIRCGIGHYTLLTHFLDIMSESHKNYQETDGNIFMFYE